MGSDDVSAIGPASAARASADILARHKELFDGPMRHLLDAMPNMVLILNEQRQAVYANQRLLELLQLSKLDEALGRRPGELLDCQHAASDGGCGTTLFCRYCGALKAILAALEGCTQVSECSITTRQSKRLELRVWATPLEVQDERFTIFAMVDISDQLRRRALEHIFFHDVLNTAGAVRGAIQLLGTAGVEHQPELERIIAGGSARLIDEIKAQRDLLEAESGELVLQLETIDSLQLLQQLLETYGTHPVARDRLLRLRTDAEAIDLHTDPTLLGRVIGNMIKNGLEASEPQETVTIDCRADSDATTVIFAVHSVAVMPKAVQQQIFDRSFSTKGPGRGLGTYSIKLLGERFLAGRVAFTSNPEQGTTFTLQIPRELRDA